MNFQVQLDITKLLRRGIRTVVRGKALWISLGYVKLPNFGYGRGKLGHVLKGCDVVADTDLDVSELQYGEWLQASPVKSKKHNADSERQEEQRLFEAF